MKSEYGHKPIRNEQTGTATKQTTSKDIAALKAKIEIISAKLMMVLKELQQLTKPAARDKGDDML